MKKTISIITIAIILVLGTLLVAGCGDSENERIQHQVKQKEQQRKQQFDQKMERIHAASKENEKYIPEEKKYYEQNFPHGSKSFVYVNPAAPHNKQDYEGRVEGIFVEKCSDKAPVMKVTIVQYVGNKFNGSDNQAFQIAKSLMPVLVGSPHKADVEAHFIADSEAFVYADHVVRIAYDDEGENYSAYVYEVDESGKYSLLEDKPERETNKPALRVLAGVGDIEDPTIFFNK